jgi:hypothetical protein
MVSAGLADVAVVSPRRRASQYNRTTHRLRELEQIILNRYNGILPVTEDADKFLLQAAKQLRRNLKDRTGLAKAEDVLDRLTIWAKRWAHFTPIGHFREIVAHAMRQPAIEKADALAAMLHLTYAERQYLKITTIGSCDVSRTERQSLSKQKKRDRDRIRAAEKRRLAGARPRSTSLSATRPWDKDGISRRTWERRRKRKSGCR